MPLPEYDPSKYALLKPGRYMFRITDPPTKRRFGKAVGIILKFLSFSEEDGSMKESSCLIWPWTDEYKVLKEEIIQSADEDDWVGRNFMGEVEIGKHPTKLGQKIQNIINIEPYYTEETKEEEPEPEPEVEDTTVTPPKEEKEEDTTPPPPEEGDPGPGEDDTPPEEEEDLPTKEEDKQEPKKKDSPSDEEAANKKDFPKKDDEKGGPAW